MHIKWFLSPLCFFLNQAVEKHTSPIFWFHLIFVLCVSRESVLPFLKSFVCVFVCVLQQSGAHAEDAASVNNSHGGLPSAGSTSSSELNHQVETFRGLISLLFPTV